MARNTGLTNTATNKYKSPCGAEGEEKARYPQGHDLLFYTILFLLSIQPENVKPWIFKTALAVFSYIKELFEATLPIGRY